MQQLHRAAAQRGKLDPVYQDLSDHWTAILQRLYPVWALIGPGLSDPGHIEIHSRTIYLDSDTLLGPASDDRRRPAGAAGGAALLRGRAPRDASTPSTPSAGRSSTTSRCPSPRPGRPAARDRPAAARGAAHGSPRRPRAPARHAPRPVHPPRARSGGDRRDPARVRPAAPRRGDRRQAADPRHGRPRDRVPAGPHPLRHPRPGRPRPVWAVWRAGARRTGPAALDELFARVIWIADGELDALDRAAREYRAIIGPPDPPPGRRGSRARRTGGGEHRDPAGASASPATGRAGSLADALEQALASARGGSSSSSTRTSTCSRCSHEAAGRGEASDARPPGRGTGLPTGRMPDRGVDRPPAPDEIQHARRYATRLRQALTHGTRQIDKRTPGGRFDGRAYTRGTRSARPAGRSPATRGGSPGRSRAPIQEPHVGLVIDTSGSMGAYEYALGPICWILTDGLRQIGGRCATALFGNSAALLSDGTRPLPLVPGIRTGGGTAFAGDAIELVSDQLEITNPRRPRFVYVLSDGGWADTQAGVDADPLARRTRRPDDPPQHRDRAAGRRVRSHPRDHRPRPRARPDRRRHRRRPTRPRPPAPQLSS